MDDRVWCPKCNRWQYVVTKENLPNADRDGLWVIVGIYYCEACEHEFKYKMYFRSTK